MEIAFFPVFTFSVSAYSVPPCLKVFILAATNPAAEAGTIDAPKKQRGPRLRASPALPTILYRTLKVIVVLDVMVPAVAVTVTW